MSTNKASIEHQTIINKAPDKHQLSINQTNEVKITQPKHQLGTNKASRRAPDRHQLSIKSEESFYYQLVGLEKAFIDYIFSLVSNSYTLKTEPISTELLVAVFLKKPNRIRTLIQRLVEKKIIKIENSSRGKSSWRIFSLDEKTFHDISLHNSIRHQLGINKAPTVAPTVAPEASSKIDSIYNTNYLSGEIGTNGTQTTPQIIAQNTSWFKDLDFSQIPIIRPMLVNSAIRKQVESELDRDDVQIFINKFKNWLASQHKIQNPVAIFCEKLKEWCNEGASDVLYALSDEEIEVEKVFALEIEKKRQELALIEKARTFKLEQDGELKFEAWFKSSTDEEKKELFKPQEFAEFGSAHYIAALKSTYLEKNG